jgi:hypothetical protein
MLHRRASCRHVLHQALHVRVLGVSRGGVPYQTHTQSACLLPCLCCRFVFECLSGVRQEGMYGAVLAGATSPHAQR